MTICLINNLFPPYHRGGVEVLVHHQVQELIRQKHHVFVIATHPWMGQIRSPSPARLYSFYPLNIFSFYSLNKFPTILRALWRLIDLFNFHAYFHIKKILQNEKPDRVYVHNLTGLGYLIPRLIQKLKIDYIQTIHDVALVRPSGLLMLGAEQEHILIKAYAKLTKFLFASPAIVHFPSAWLSDYYLARNFFPHSQTKVVKNFQLSTKDLISNKTLKNKKEINFLYLGQLERHKGIFLLLGVFHQLKDKNYKLHIVGSGSELDSAQKIAAANPRIIFHGYRPQYKIKQFLVQADYSILPSLCYENSPNAIFESLSAGVPVIASNLGGIAELITPGRNGYLFDPVDKNNLIKILKNDILIP